MTEIVLYANDEVLELVKAPTISSGDVNCVSLSVNFSSEWDGFTKVAVLFNGDFSPESNHEKILSNGKCTIPGEVLKDAEPFYIGIKGIKPDATKTTTILKYQVIKGVPTIITEITEDVYQQILAAYANLETIRNEVDADAKQTAADRAEVKKMIDSVSDIGEQVAKVEKLSQQAQESATQAETSATAAEKAKEQAETAKAGAETAAGKTAEDRTAVNQAKTSVEKAQRAVRADRTAVEEAKQSVEQLGNAIPEATKAGVQAVNQAKQTAVDEIVQTGTAHKTAVEGAGTKAVQDVENVKQTATEAVETAKTEATQAVQTEGTKQIKDVQEKGTEVLQSIPEDFPTQMEAKLNKQQGIENKGKALVIGDDGLVIPGEVQSGGGDGIAIINTMSGESPLAIPDSAERTLERLELDGKTEQVQTTGKNLIDIKPINKETNEYIIRCLFEKNIYIRCNESTTTTTGDIWRIKVTYKDGTLKYVTDGNMKKGMNFVASTENPIVGISPRGVSIVSGSYAKIQVEYGDKATTYEPYTGGQPSPSPEYPQEIKSVGKWNKETQKYEVGVKVTNTEQSWSKEQTITLTSDRPITKWDKLVEQGGEIGWLYKSKIIDSFDGQSNKINIANKQGDVQNFSILFENVVNGNGNLDIFVDKYRAVEFSYTKAEYGICCNWNGGIKYFSAPNENVTTVDEFKAWLVENPLKIAYETMKTEFIPLSQSEQNAIRALKTYYPTTVITVDGGELDPDIKATYTADTKNYIDNKISAKMASIMSQYQNRTVKLLSLMPMETQAAMIENDTNNILESEVTQ